MTTTASKALSPKDNSVKVLKHLLKEAELDRNLLIAIMANIAVETGYTFDYQTKQKGKRSDPAYGLFQFDARGSGLGKLYPRYLDYRKSEDSMEAQLDLIVDTLTRSWNPGVSHVGSGNVTKVLDAASISPALATEAFCSHILRPGKPHLDRRLAAVSMIESLMAEVISA